MLFAFGIWFGIWTCIMSDLRSRLWQTHNHWWQSWWEECTRYSTCSIGTSFLFCFFVHPQPDRIRKCKLCHNWFCIHFHGSCLLFCTHGSFVSFASCSPYVILSCAFPVNLSCSDQDQVMCSYVLFCDWFIVFIVHRCFLLVISQLQLAL